MIDYIFGSGLYASPSFHHPQSCSPARVEESTCDMILLILLDLLLSDGGAGSSSMQKAHALNFSTAGISLGSSGKELMMSGTNLGLEVRVGFQKLRSLETTSSRPSG